MRNTSNPHRLYQSLPFPPERPGRHSEQRLLLVYPGTWGTGPLTIGWWIGDEATASIVEPPRATLFFTPDGSFNYLDGVLTQLGTNGYYWTASAVSSTNAYAMYFGESWFSASGSLYRNYGHPVRCVAEF